MDSLTPARWNGIIAALQSGEGAIRLPRFTLAGAYDLKRPIANLGMGLAFSDFADFSRISTVPLKITSVRQRTWIDVNEEGTEAAAATSVGIGVTSAPVAFVVDRPFVFAIRERFSGAILFLGKITTLPAPAS
ncbi:MAG: hypothetical protein HY275_10665 [Gemmatimonadetes bacterium]|nr:hypothetical protein [Gemmatimonadota bacterium]